MKLLGHRSAKSRLLSACFALSLLTNVVGAQDSSTAKVMVGDPSVDGSYIKPSKSHWKVTLTTTDGNVVDRGKWTDELQVVELKGRRVIKRLQEWTTPDGKLFQTVETVVDAKTFAPIVSDYKRADGLSGHKEYDGVNFKDTYVSTPNSETKKVEAKLETQVFDFSGGMFGLLLAAFPLKEGYSASLPMDTLDNDGNATIYWLTFHVKGREKVDAGAGRQVDAWVVETTAPQARWQFLLSREEAPYVFRVKSIRPNGNTMMWTL